MRSQFHIGDCIFRRGSASQTGTVTSIEDRNTDETVQVVSDPIGYDIQWDQESRESYVTADEIEPPNPGDAKG